MEEGARSDSFNWRATSKAFSMPLMLTFAGLEGEITGLALGFDKKNGFAELNVVGSVEIVRSREILPRWQAEGCVRRQR